MPLGVGLAGLGVHGSRYAEHLLAGDVKGARLAAVSRSNAAAGREFASEHGIRFVDDPCELAHAPGVDLVVAALPPDLHPAVAEACLAAGRPVLVEKPLAADVVSARRIAELASRTGTPLMVAHTLRFDAVVQEIARHRDRIGPLRMISINQRFEPAARPWLDSPAGGGIVLNTAVHGFDLLRHLTGLEPHTMFAETHAVVTRRTADELLAVMRFGPGDVLALLDNARTTRGRSGRIELVGEEGQLWGDHIHRTLDFAKERSFETLGPIAPRPTVPAVLDAFVKSIVHGTQPPVSAADGVATLVMAEAAERSAREGRRVEITELRSA